MPSAIILLADGSEEIEFVTVYDVLVRAGFQVQSVGVKLGSKQYATLSRGVKIIPDQGVLGDNLGVPDILVLPGGGPGAKTFSEDKTTLDYISHCRNSEKWVACICAGTTALVAATEQAKATVTSHPSVKDAIVAKGWEYSDDRVVVCGKVITSRGPGTALLWALTIVELLCGKGKRNEIEGPMITSTVF